MFVLIRKGASAQRRVRYENILSHRSYASTSSLASQQDVCYRLLKYGEVSKRSNVKKNDNAEDFMIINSSSSSRTILQANLKPQHPSRSEASLTDYMVSDAARNASMSLLRSTMNSSSAPYRSFSSIPLEMVISNYPAYQRAYFSSSSKFSTSTKIPTPKSSPPEPAQSALANLKNFDVKVLGEKGLGMTVSALKTILLVLLKTPGNIFYYLTHAKERKEKIQGIRAIIKHEIDHYWMGSKLLMADVQTARHLMTRTLTGSTLTRRERKQLLRTVSDLFRLVPFSMFILIPFMEFALPFALRLFPNMLPSTFQDSLKAEENMKRELKSRIAMAQFFQETLSELAQEQKRIATKEKKENSNEGQEGGEVTIATKQEETAASMLEFLDRARSGEMLPPDVIIQYANYFKDDLTLDNMPRMQLVNMCKYMSIPPYGADAFLRFQLRHRIKSLREDDQRILWEGMSSLTKMELREACQERGMRSTGLSKEAYRRSLQQWLDLSVNKNVPISLLIMSRTFFLQEEMSTPSTDDDSKSVAGLADAISGLDKEVLNEVILQVATSEEKKSDPDVRKIKLEVLTQQNEKIRQEQAERDAVAKKKESSEKATEAAEAIAKLEEAVAASGNQTSEEYKGADKVHLVVEKVWEDPPEEKVSEEKEKKADDDTDLTAEEMDAISQLLSADPVRGEREELQRIKASMKSDDEMDKLLVLKKLEDIVAAGGGPPSLVDHKVEAHSKAHSKPHGVKPKSDEATAAETIQKLEQAAAADAAKSTLFSTSTGIPQPTAEGSMVPPKSPEQADEPVESMEEYAEEEVEDPIVARLKKRIESMVDKIELQLSDVEVKIGDKLHFLDKDMDGILSLEEMAECLQQVLKRDITFEEAMEIASEMDTNGDGVFTVQELINWIETNKLMKYEEEGRDADMDRMMETPASENQKEEQPKSETEKEKASQKS